MLLRRRGLDDEDHICFFFPMHRCIPCKGARFPPTLPRPAVAILSFTLPYCQVTTEKGQMEVWNDVETTADCLRHPHSRDYTSFLLIISARKRVVQTLHKAPGKGGYLSSGFWVAFFCLFCFTAGSRQILNEARVRVDTRFISTL